MAFNFASAGPAGVTATSPARKTPEVVAVKLTHADFTTGGTASVKAVLPADASIIGFRYWTKTAFSGNGVTALALAIGITGTTTKYLSQAIPAVSAGNFGWATGVTGGTGAFQDADPTNRSDIPLLFTGTATTGNPTAGEAYVLIEYVR